MPNPTCTVPGCVKPARSPKAPLCPMHYHRQYRHGSVDVVSTGKDAGTRKPRKYRRLRATGHPVADRNGMAYEHRYVLFEMTKDADVTCHWCGMGLDWAKRKTDAECVHVDHLNGVTDDNRPENLAPSCRGCNVARGVQERSDALRELGWWSKNDTIESLSNGGRKARIVT